MSVIAVPTPFNIDVELNLASVWKRGLAFVLDIVILWVYKVLLDLLVKDNLPYDEVARGIIYFLLFFLPVTFYHFLMEIFFNGQSVGKMVLGIRVVNFMGNKANISQYLIRFLFRSSFLAFFVAMILAEAVYEYGSKDFYAYIMTAVGFWALLSFGMCLYYLVSKNRQRIGDTLANTLVIENKSEADFHKTIYLEIGDTTYVPDYPEVMRLTDRDINGIRNLLDTKKLTTESQSYMDRIANRIVEVLGIKVKPGQDSWDFLVQLLKDYNYLTSK